MFDVEKVFDAVNRHELFDINLFGYKLSVSSSLLVIWIVSAVLIVLALITTRKLSVDKPSKVQCVLEKLVEFVRSVCKESMGHHWRVFVPYIGTVLVFLVLSNIITIFNFFPFVHLYPPTKDINVTGTLAVMSILIVLFSGIRYRGVGGWFKGLFKPMPVMLPMNLLEYVTKPLSLCLRLFGNVVAAFIIMEIVLSVFAPAGSVLSIYFDLFDGILQAYIFVYLTSIYIGEAVEVED